ncbi:MAG: hypothetical protein RIK87_13515 [Fuerstiella sp.]
MSASVRQQTEFSGDCARRKYDKDRLFNDQLKYCHAVAASSGDNAAKNTALQHALLDLMELFAVTGNTASKSMFRALYLQKRARVWGWAEWYSYKWKNIKPNREPQK